MEQEVRQLAQVVSKLSLKVLEGEAKPKKETKKETLVHRKGVFSKDLNELHGGVAERSSLLEANAELGDFFSADTTVFGEQAEAFAVLVKLSKILHVFVHIVEVLILRSSCEENAGIATFNSIFLAESLVVLN